MLKSDTGQTIFQIQPILDHHRPRLAGVRGVLMKSSIIKRSVVIGGHKASVSSDLKKIAHAQAATLSELVAEIDETRQRGNLSSAIRLFVLEHIRLVK